MKNDEQNLTPDDDSILPDDDARFAPPSDLEPDSPEIDESPVEETVSEITVEDTSVEADPDISVTDDMDIEAALAAVSTLSDMLAEQEAAEQARIAQLEAEAQAAAERQARLEHPEQFFPVPPMTVLHRGQMASVVPALLLIVIGAWLTFTFTTKAPPSPLLTAAVAFGSIGIALLVRWFSAGRWTRGSLFAGLSLVFSAGLLLFLSSPASPGLINGWPLLLVGVGIAAALTSFLAFPRDRRFLFSGIAFAVAGIAASVVSMNLLGSDFGSIAASLWPVAVVLVAVIWLLPVIFRQRS
jgi:hypothetical protein